MTLCIAAACQYKDKASFVLCSDTRSLSGTREWGLTVCSENADKSRVFGEDENFAAVIAGHPTDGDELITHCEAAIKNFSERPQDTDDFDLYLNELFEGIRAASRTRMKQIQDHYIATYSPFKGHDDFLARGKVSLPDVQYRELWHDVSHLTLNAEVIIGGIHSGQAILIKIDNKGNPHWEDQYSVVGTGSAEALAFLAQNEYDENEIRLEDCLMRMVEALDFVSTANNTVGHMSRFEIHLEGGPTCDLKDEFFKTLKSKIRLSSPVELGDCGEFLDLPDKEGVSSESEQEKPSTEPADAGNEHSSGPSSGGTEGGNSAPTSGIPGDGTQQP
jgi:20S proteasome alpha/beta subunit